MGGSVHSRAQGRAGIGKSGSLGHSSPAVHHGMGAFAVCTAWESGGRSESQSCPAPGERAFPQSQPLSRKQA